MKKSKQPEVSATLKEQLIIAAFKAWLDGRDNYARFYRDLAYGTTTHSTGKDSDA